MLRHPYTYLPPVRYRDHCQLSLTYLQEWLRQQAVIPAGVHYEHAWGANYQLGPGLALDWFTSHQQQYIGVMASADPRMAPG